MSRKKASGTTSSAVVVVLLALLGLFWFYSQEKTAPNTAPTPGPAPVGDASAQLATLAIAPEGTMAGYSRDRFPHWASQGDSCDTRELVLQRQGKDVKTDAACKATSGQWTSPYDGLVITKAADIDIDHTVPLAEAWRSGADKWTDEDRKKFANDLGGAQLLAASATTNRAKGDQDPAKWKPAVQSYWCVYSQHWISVKATYGLTIDQAEHDALASMLATCPA